MLKLPRAVLVAATAMLVLAIPAHASPSDVTRVAVIGDSTVTGYGVAPWQSWTYHFEAQRPGDNILPLGVNGATTRIWLQQHLPRLDQLRSWQTESLVIVVVLGSNDYHINRPALEYAHHLTQLDGYLNRLVPGATVVFLHHYRINVSPDPSLCDAQPGDPVGCMHAVPPSTWDEYGTAMRAAALAVGAVYLDISGTRDWSQLQLDDMAHLTPQGHRFYYQDFYAALIAARR